MARVNLDFEWVSRSIQIQNNKFDVRISLLKIKVKLRLWTFYPYLSEGSQITLLDLTNNW